MTGKSRYSFCGLVAMCLVVPTLELFGQPAATLVDERCLLTGRARTAVYCLAISPDGGTLVAGENDKKVTVWDLTKNRVKYVLEGHANVPQFAAVSSDGAKAITAAAQGGPNGEAITHVIVWDLATGNREQDFTTAGVVKDMTQCGRFVANLSEDNKSCGVYEIQKGKKTVVHAVAAPFYRCGLAPDGHTLATAEKGGTMRLWDVASGKQRLKIDTEWPPLDVFERLFFTPDNKTFVVMRACKVCFWDAASGKQVPPKDINSSGKLFTPDGKYLLSMNLQLTSVKSGAKVAQFAYDDPLWEEKALAVSPDGRFIAVGGTPQGKIRIWDMPKPLPE